MFCYGCVKGQAHILKIYLIYQETWKERKLQNNQTRLIYWQISNTTNHPYLISLGWNVLYLSKQSNHNKDKLSFQKFKSTQVYILLQSENISNGRDFCMSAIEHIRAFYNKKADSIVHKQNQIFKNVVFGLEITGIFKDPLTRQEDLNSWLLKKLSKSFCLIK